MIARLLKAGADPGTTSSGGETALLTAARNGNAAAVKVLLAYGAGPNGTTALHIACINAHWELGSLLLDRGADANAAGPGGTALHHIARVRNATLLVKSGGLPPPVATGTMTAMELVKQLVAHGADV